MKIVTRWLKGFVVLVVLAVVGILVVTNYSYVFSKHVTGVVMDVERVTDPSAIVGSRATEAQMYSYSILIQGDDGHMYTSSSEDRQWQVVKKGYCVEALLYRYPPWRLSLAGNFFNARVLDVKVCPGQSGFPANQPPPAGAPEATPPPAGTPSSLPPAGTAPAGKVEHIPTH